MTLSPAETRVLHLIAQTGHAQRVFPGHSAFTWHVKGKPESGSVDRLIRKGVLALSKDNMKAILSARGRVIVQQLREAA